MDPKSLIPVFMNKDVMCIPEVPAWAWFEGTEYRPYMELYWKCPLNKDLSSAIVLYSPLI